MKAKENSEFALTHTVEVKHRALKLVIQAYFMPLLCSIFLLQITLFFSYPPLGAEMWIITILFSLPISFFAFIYLLHPRPQPLEVERMQNRNFFFGNRSYRLFIALSIVYTLSMVYRYIFVGAVLTDGITGARYVEIAEGAGQGGVITGVTTLTSGAPAFLLLAIIERLGLQKKVNPMVVALTILGIFSSFLSGGRNSFLICLVFIYMAGLIWPTLSVKAALSGRSAKTVIVKTLLYSALALAIFYSLYVFIERGLLRTDDLIYRAILTATESGYIFDSSKVPTWMGDGVYFALANLHNYFTLGLVYFDRLLEVGLPNGHLGGSYNFYVFFLIFEKLTGLSIVADLSTDLPINGAYYTLPGSIFVDFGILGVAIFAIFLPVALLIVISKALRGTRRVLPLASLGLTILAMAPLYNAASVGAGPSLLFISLLFILVGDRKIKKWV
ncbi:hypothetical protein K3728_01155 [Rhodobacteraceae bacterium M385]|nr:hypothetical protein K3728_01155 [Rhodobacteraceae bacterium M385]